MIRTSRFWLRSDLPHIYRNPRGSAYTAWHAGMEALDAARPDRRAWTSLWLFYFRTGWDTQNGRAEAKHPPCSRPAGPRRLDPRQPSNVTGGR